MVGVSFPHGRGGHADTRATITSGECSLPRWPTSAAASYKGAGRCRTRRASTQLEQPKGFSSVGRPKTGSTRGSSETKSSETNKSCFFFLGHRPKRKSACLEVAVCASVRLGECGCASARRGLCLQQAEHTKTSRQKRNATIFKMFKIKTKSKTPSAPKN